MCRIIRDAKSARSLPEPDAGLDHLASTVVDAAIEVHRALGPGFLESIYERAMCLELGLRGLTVQRQVPLSVTYKDHRIGAGQLDLLVAERLVVELKAVQSLERIHSAQLLSYLRATRCQLGLLINFNVPLLSMGVRRIIASR